MSKVQVLFLVLALPGAATAQTRFDVSGLAPYLVGTPYAGLEASLAGGDQVRRQRPDQGATRREVVDGAIDPLAEWRDYHEGQNIPEPGKSLANR